MTLEEFIAKWPLEPWKTYIIRIAYKYSDEINYTVSNEVASTTENMIEWLNDWNEGQQDIIVLGWCDIDLVPVHILLH